jgi:SAM-dependent methyltransferase
MQDWEWVIGLNNGGTVPRYIEDDPRVHILNLDDDDPVHNRIGRLKRQCALQARGEIIVELDADDMLTEDALQEIEEAFENPDIHMAYSNSAEFEDGTWTPRVYSGHWGWVARKFEWHGHALVEMIAWPPSVQMMRRIEWAPNHVRAWRATSYFDIGGHDESMKNGDDHDLCCRLYVKYGAAGFRHIDKCLYLYRVHPKNSSRTNNAEVQATTDRNYLKYSRDMMIRWAKDNKLRMLDLGGRFNAWTGFETVDRFDADVTCDLNKRWPFADGSVGVIRASHIFEHLKDPIHVMNEAYRILAPGGWLLIEVPSTDGRGAFQDPTHRSFWNSNSIWYYTRESHARFIRPGYGGRFQVSRIVDYFPTDFEQQNNIVITQADLIALKAPYSDRPAGEVLI